MPFSYPVADTDNFGQSDTHAYFTQLWQRVYDERLGKLLIPPGDYHLSKPLILHAGNASDAYRNKLAIEAIDAVFDNEIVFIDQSVMVEGLSVYKSANCGFRYLRGQGSLFTKMHAEECKSHGHVFGTDSNDPRQPNSQVTGSEWQLPSAVNNEGDGFHWDGSASANRSWFNANLITTDIARGNARGYGTKAGNGPRGGSQMNYNTFVNQQLEGNADSSDLSEFNQRGHTCIGGLVSDVDQDVISLKAGTVGYYLGGRYVGSIANKEDNTVKVNTAIRGESAKLNYDNGFDN